MPVYEYHCHECGVFDQLRPLSEHKAPAHCPQCGQSSARVISLPRLSVISRHQRKAHETNERSQHEPKVHKASSCCASGHCSHHKKTSTDSPRTTNAQTLKAPVGNRRPWMISH